MRVAYIAGEHYKETKKKNMFNFIEVGLNLDIKFFITVEHKANLKKYFALRAQILSLIHI